MADEDDDFTFEFSAADAGMPADADANLDPDRLTGCAYWRCDEIFEARSANHVFCRKACRSRQRKWERAQVRRQRKAAARASRRPPS